MRSNIFSKLSFVSLFLVITLLPFFFLPFTRIPIGNSKGALLVIGLAFAVIFWGFARFFDGKIILPRSASLLGGGAVVLAVLLSAFFVKDSQVSFFGTMFDVGSFSFILAGFILMLMCSIIFRDVKNARVVLFGAILSSSAILLFQCIHLLKPGFSLGVLSATVKTSNLLGSWNEFGIFAGFSALMSLLMIEFFSTTKIERLILRILIIVSMFFIAAVNFSLVWGLFGLSALIIFVYKISISSRENISENTANNDNSEKKKVIFPTLSFTIIMIALLFFMSGDSIGNFLPNKLGIQNNEVSISFDATMGVIKSVLQDNLVFGIGPNKFGEAWAMYKPVGANAPINGDLWNAYISTGSGLLPTMVATIGYVGIIAWLLFFVLFIIGGARSIFTSVKNGVNWETMAFFVLSLYLFVSSFFYSTGPVTFLLALAFAGVFAGLSASHSQNGEITLAFLSDHRKSFFSMLFIVLLIIISAATSFKYLERFSSVPYFQKALSATTVPDALTAISQAINLYPNDLYLRTYSQIQFVKLNSLAQKKGTELSETEKADIKTSIEQSVLGANEAIAHNPKNYLNFQALGSLYETLGAFGVKDAYASAVEAYKKAALLNPNNPGLKLSMATASFADKKVAESKDYAKVALQLKPDYVDAWIVLSQIAKSEGDNANALSYAQTALFIIPDNQNLIKYVDSFKNGSSNTAVTPAATSSPDPTPKVKDTTSKKK